MIGLLVLGAMVGLALATVQRLWIPVSVAFAVLILVPQVASPVIGLPLVGGMNVATALLFVTAVVQFTVRAREYASDIAASFPVYGGVAMFVVGAVLTSISTNTTAHQQFILDSVMGSVLGFTLVRRALADDAHAGRRIASTFVAVAVVESALALLVWSGAVAQPFIQQYATTYYWFADDFGRALGTADSPLNLGVVLTIATCLLQGIRRAWVIVPCAALFIAAVLATESRTALLLCIIAILVIMVRRRVPFVAFAAFGLVTAASTAIAIAAVPELTAGLLDKLTNDSGSANARQIGLTQGIPSMFDFPMLGGGPDTAVVVANQLGLGTSFENPVIMLALNWGMLGTLCFFAAQVSAVAMPSSGARAVPGGRLAGLAALVAILTFSSVAFVSGLGTIVWMTLALAAPRLPPRRSGAGSAFRSAGASDSDQGPRDRDAQIERPVRA